MGAPRAEVNLAQEREHHRSGLFEQAAVRMLRNILLRHLSVWLLTAPLTVSQVMADLELSASLVARVTDEVDADASRLVDIFKDIHQNPELGMMEVRTAGIVASELSALGYEVKTGIGNTGVVGVLRNGEGPTVMYRADMDALAVEEATGLPYASTTVVKRADGEVVPVSHMCGHDAHTTWLISVAKTLASVKDTWRGTLVLVAQPAEEPLTGAKAMVADGLFTRHGIPEPDYYLAQHSMPFPTGTIITSPNTLMAGTEQLEVTFHGVGGHGSAPHYAKDPVVMAAMAILQYQTIISRIIDPSETAVLTVGAVNGGIDANVIPEDVSLKLNLRFFDNEVHEQLTSAIRSISNGIAQSYGMPEERFPEMETQALSTPLVNTATLVDRLVGMLNQASEAGVENVVTDLPPFTGSEDAHLLVDALDGVEFAFLFIGAADKQVFAKAQAEGKQVPFSNHSPFYQIDLKAIPLGAKVAALSLLEVLNKAQP